jgi:uncharacterized protein (TIGR01244 family)|uniref:TIGR01244 family phosphatase n=1 Tax=Acidicaldus sp. TaxID=1872105 RepID=A0A8J4H8N8_9PROT
MQPKHLSHKLSVSTQLTHEDFSELAKGGVRTVINNRPDGEDAGQMTAAAAAALARQHGMDYHHIPLTMKDISPEAIERFAAVLEKAEGRVHAHCRSGTRSALLWALSEVKAGRMSVDEACAAVAKHGFDVPPAVVHHHSQRHSQGAKR